MFGTKARKIKMQAETIEALQGALKSKEALGEANDKLIAANKSYIESLENMRAHQSRDLANAGMLLSSSHAEVAALKLEVRNLNNQLHGVREPNSLDMALLDLLARSNNT